MERVLLLAETRPADHKIVSWVLLLFCDNIIIWGGNVCPSAKCVDERMMFIRVVSFLDPAPPLPVLVSGVNRRVSAESWPKTLGVGASTYAISAEKKMVVRRRYSA